VDPEWSEMITESKVIALVEYIESGDFKPKAKALKIYKGQLESNEFWIGNFSNRYGPIDTMNKGEKHIVFLRFLSNKSKKVLSTIVWSPTSGDLKVKGDKVQYDLLQTTHYSKQKFYDLELFEEFLYATQSPSEDFHPKILNKLKKNYDNELAVQYMMMLSLSSYSKYDPIFRKIKELDELRHNAALAPLLGNIRNSKSRKLLVDLLSFKHSVLQGEVVRQLANFDPNIVGPILVDFLNRFEPIGEPKQNLRNPVMNTYTGGRKQIIRTLGDMKYKPAEEKLIELLKSEDIYTFELVAESLVKLGSKKYINVLIDYLEQQNLTMVYRVCKVINEYNLNACKPALLNFISNIDKSHKRTPSTVLTTVSKLIDFNDTETRDFLVNDYKNMLDKDYRINIHNIRGWITNFLKVFEDLNIENRKELLFLAIDKWFGYNEDFVKHPELFEIRNQIEEEYIERIKDILPNSNIKYIRVIVFLKNTKEFSDTYESEYDVEVKIGLRDYQGSSHIQNTNVILNKIAKELSISTESLILYIGNNIYNRYDRFEKSIHSTPLAYYDNYILEYPSQEELIFLKNIYDFNQVLDKESKESLKTTIKKAEKKLGVTNPITFDSDNKDSKILWFPLLGVLSIVVVVSIFIFYRKRRGEESV